MKYEWAHSNVTKLVDCGAVGGGARERDYGAVGGVEKLREAPPIISLEEYEKFRDEDGNVFEVEVRGVRDVKKIFFKGRDLEKVFKMVNLRNNAQKDRTVYKENVDYVYFHVSSENSNRYCFQTTHEGNRLRKMFFSYDGFMLAIYRSNSGNAYRFRNWANKVVYTAHVGTSDQRIEQAIEMLGANADIVKEVFRTCVAKVPCVYLFHIGKVVEMQSYPDLNQFSSGMLFKYGRTDNLSRRLGEHMGTFGTLEGSRFKLSYWSPINVNNVVTAESQLSTFFDDKKIAFLNHNEVVLLSRDDLKSVKEKYLEIYNDLGIVCDMVAIVKQNKKLISSSQAQKLLLEEKDKMVVHLNLEIKMLNSERQVWNEENERWLDREKEWFDDKERLEKRVKKVINAYRNQTRDIEELSKYCFEMQKEHEFELSHVQEKCKADFDNLEIVYLAGDISNLCLDTQYESD